MFNHRAEIPGDPKRSRCYSGGLLRVGDQKTPRPGRRNAGRLLECISTGNNLSTSRPLVNLKITVRNSADNRPATPTFGTCRPSHCGMSRRAGLPLFLGLVSSSSTSARRNPSSKRPAVIVGFRFGWPRRYPAFHEVTSRSSSLFRMLRVARSTQTKLNTCRASLLTGQGEGTIPIDAHRCGRPPVPPDHSSGDGSMRVTRRKLLGAHPSYLVLIEGHCDNRAPRVRRMCSTSIFGERPAEAAMKYLLAVHRGE
jgi:hypothetical protein